MSKLVPALLLVNTLLLGGVVALLYLRPPGAAPAAAQPSAEHAEEKKEGDEHEGPKVGPMVRLPDFVIHLRNPEADRYVRMTVELELASETDRDKITAYMPRIRDAYLAWLSDRTLEEMRGSEGLAKTKQSLLEQADLVVPGRAVRAVYIADFVVQ